MNKDINDIYQITEQYDNDGNWKGYLCSVIKTNLPFRPIKPYSVPIKYDENKRIDEEKSINGLQ